jgi:hypothetical protein
MLSVTAPRLIFLTVIPRCFCEGSAVHCEGTTQQQIPHKNVRDDSVGYFATAVKAQHWRAFRAKNAQNARQCWCLLFNRYALISKRKPCNRFGLRYAINGVGHFRIVLIAEIEAQRADGLRAKLGCVVRHA